MSSLFQTLLRPDRDDDPEKSLVADAANLLEIGEFQLVQLAYYEWHGRDADGQEIERIFAEYMFHQRVAPWLRHFARGVLAQSQAGDLDARAPCWHRFDAAPPAWRQRTGVGRFVAACSLTVGIVVITVWLSHVTTGSSASMFPPYIDRYTVDSAGEDGHFGPRSGRLD